MKNSSKYFKNEECEYFPCHKVEGEFFNCMFCCCPLFPLGDKYGGNFVYIEGGIKDCSACTIPHTEWDLKGSPQKYAPFRKWQRQTEKLKTERVKLAYLVK